MDNLYVHRPVLNAHELHAWATAQGVKNLLPPEEMHVTQVYSRKPVDETFVPHDDTIVVKRKIELLGPKNALVLSFNSDALQARHAQAMAAGASHDFDGYHPHVTLSYDAGDVKASDLTPPTFPIHLGPEVHAPLNENWAQDKGFRKDITATSVHTPTALGNEDEKEAMTTVTDVNPSFRIAKVDDSLGLVFGWAVVCKVKGEDYYDLNVDWVGKHAGERVPEHIPEPVMLKAALDITKVGTLPGNEMHEGPDQGHYPFLFPMTTDIAKAMGITTEKTGLMCAFKPPPGILAKFKPGPNGEPPEYTGFSIEGKRLSYEEHD